jgi:uncharacterized repeat protein (TIGR03806 family)
MIVKWKRWMMLPFGLAFATCGGSAEPMDENEIPRTCVAPPRPRVDAKVRWERVFDEVEIEDAVSLVKARGERWYVLAKTGVIHTFEDRADARATPFLDLSDRIEDASEAGLLGLAFPDDFATSGRFFVHYTAPGGSAFLSRISEFSSSDGVADPSSERVVLEVDQPFVNHNGGDIHFGPDGYLYWALGDGGSAGDPQGHGQDLETLLGAIVRIDVSSDAPEPYGIPDDNPFADGGGRPEIYAWGFRNPYRWSFDRDTGQMWVGDVGQHAWEELDRVVLGGNYGWKITEGTDCFGSDRCDDAQLEPPHAQYRNTGTASIVAGYAYRGSLIPDLEGTVLYSDFYFGSVFGVASEGGEAEVVGEGARGIAAWAEGDDGELYGINYFDGSVYALRPVSASDEPDRFPRSILETGCVDPTNLHAPGPGTIAYEVNHPFWSDGADKERYIALPDGTSAELGPDGDLDLPTGTVVMKSFFDSGDRPIETRLLVRHEDDGWAGYTWAWNADGSDATFVEQTRTETIDGRPWLLPGPRDCMACHTNAAGRSLGLEVGQLSPESLAALVPSAPEGAPSLPAVDGDAPLEQRARAYLHVNCSPCHRDEGTGGRSNLDLRFDLPLEDTHLCDSPRAGDLDVDDPAIVVPGAPERSILLARIEAEGSARMPPLGRTTTDTAGADLISAWITALDACP